MHSSLICRALRIQKSAIHGYGVFAGEDIPLEAIIEESRVLITPTFDPHFQHYYFSAPDKKFALVLGNGSLYNHSSEPNAKYEYDEEAGVFRFTAVRLIKQDEEIYIGYGKNWFSARNISMKTPGLRYRFKKWLPTVAFLVRFLLVAGIILLVGFLRERMH